MGWHLIGLAWPLASISGILSGVGTVLLVIVGLNFVILVHELGHFLVAKLCGVKCEKFYIWFDAFGFRLGRFRWGETEYGVGWLPLGGYVKMLGQEDNPARLREEIARAKARQTAEEVPIASSEAAAIPAVQAVPADSADSCEPIDVAAAEQALYDPRSYLAQSVPKRMAIISAGVIMNVIFAFVLAVWAYALGVFQAASAVGDIAPGEGAWQANFRVGDEVLAINGKPTERFSDLQRLVSLGDISNGITMLIKRPGVEKPFTVKVEPDRLGLAPSIGVTNAREATLVGKSPVTPGTAAAAAQPSFEGGDTIVEIDGHKVADYADIYRQLALHPDKKLHLVVERQPPQADGEKAAPVPPQRVAIELPPQPMYRLGLVMKMGPVVAVQAQSPAEAAGIRPGDVLTAIDDQPVGDPVTLAERLRERADRGERATLTVNRDGQSQRFPDVPLRKADWTDWPIFLKPHSSAAAPALGIAYTVDRVVEAVLKGTPASEAGIEPGEEIVAAKVIPPDKEEIAKLKLPKDVEVKSVEIDFRDRKENATWPWFLFARLNLNSDGETLRLPGSMVELTFAGGGKARLLPYEVKGWFDPNRGLRFKAEGSVVKGKDLASMIRLGYRETTDQLTLVFRFLSKVGRQVSVEGMGGPISIFRIAYDSAAKGTVELLMFLTMISANLAVINFLPIPVLDGGHMVFLLYEGVTGRAPDERIQAALTWAGLILLLGLMIFVTRLDIGRLTHWW